jgi:hypothetical protein
MWNVGVLLREGMGAFMHICIRACRGFGSVAYGCENCVCAMYLSVLLCVLMLLDVCMLTSCVFAEIPF